MGTTCRVFPVLGVAALLLLAGCPKPSGGVDGGPDAGPDAGIDAGPRVCGGCTRNRDCAHLNSNRIYYCDRPSGCCEPTCLSDADCDWIEPELCSGGACWCDGSSGCVLAPCLSHTDCRGVAPYCIGGTCSAALVDACEISPKPLLLRPGTERALKLAGLAAGEPRVAGLSGSWSSDDPAVILVRPDTGVVLAGGPAGTATVTATTEGVSCSVRVTNPGFVTSEVRVTLLRDMARTPVTGARVVVADTATGAELETGTTDDAGTILATVASGATFDLHVFPVDDPTDLAASNGRSQLSFLGLTERDLLVYLPPNPTPTRAAGFRGEYSLDDFLALGPDDVHLAIAGASSTKPLFELAHPELFGESVPTRVVFGSLLDGEVAMPAGAVLGVGSEFFRNHFVAVGRPGTRAGWALGGNLPIQEFTNALGPIVVSGEALLFQTQTIGFALNHLSHSAVAPRSAVVLDELDRIPGLDLQGNAVLQPDEAGLPSLDLPLTLRSELRGLIEVPITPLLTSGDHLDLVIAVAGVLLPGEGFLPLGFAAGFDDPSNTEPNGIIEDYRGDPNPGQLYFRFARTHHGLEGLRYHALLLAMRTDLADRPLTISGKISSFDSLSFQETVPFTASPFLVPGESARWDPATRSYTPPTSAPGSFGQVVFETLEGKRWIVSHPGGASPGPLLSPAAHACGASTCDDPAAAPATVEARTMEASVSLDQLLGIGGPDLDRISELVTGFSRAEIAP